MFLSGEFYFAHHQEAVTVMQCSGSPQRVSCVVIMLHQRGRVSLDSGGGKPGGLKGGLVRDNIVAAGVEFCV